MLDVYTLRCRAHLEVGMINMPVCLVLDHVPNNTVFRCDAEVQDLNVLGRLCTKPLSFSEFPFRLGAFVLNPSAETLWAL